jgi:hypothetical protein
VGLVTLGLFVHPQWLVRWRRQTHAGAPMPFPSHCFAFARRLYLPTQGS